MPTEPPVEVSIHLRVQNEYGQWGIAILGEGGALSFRTGEIEPRGCARSTRTEAAVAAFAAVLEAAAGRPYVILDVAPGRLRLAIAELVESVPRIVLAEPSWEAPEHRAALVEAMKAMPEHVPAKARAGAVNMVVSTDASVNARGQVAGLGFVIAAEDGSVLSVGHKTEQVPRKGDILTGELHAILWALQAMNSRHPVPLPGQGTVTVESDSKAALGLLETVRAGRTPSGGTKEQVQAAERILAESAHMPVEFRWVRGHAGHRGNEAADRLAVLARRGEEFNVPRETREKMFACLRDELVGRSAA